MEDSQKCKNILQKKDERKRNYKVLQKHWYSCQELIMLNTWKAEEWALLKLLKFISWLLSTEIYVGPLAWVYAPAKMGGLD